MGYGSNEADLFGLAAYLDPRFLILSARAPYTLMHGSYAWFELGWAASGISIDARQAEASRKLVVEFIRRGHYRLRRRPAPGLPLCGFSQGAILASSVALTQLELVAGAVLMSGRVPGELKPLIARPSAWPISRSWSYMASATRCCRSRTAAPAGPSSSSCRST